MLSVNGFHRKVKAWEEFPTGHDVLFDENRESSGGIKRKRMFFDEMDTAEETHQSTIDKQGWPFFDY